MPLPTFGLNPCGPCLSYVRTRDEGALEMSTLVVSPPCLLDPSALRKANMTSIEPAYDARQKTGL